MVQTSNEIALLLIKFTALYRSFSEEETELREVMCYRLLLKGMVKDFEQGDLFAGRIKQLPIGFAPQSDEGSFGYYLHPNAFSKLLNDKNLKEDIRTELEKAGNFWELNSTVHKTKQAFTPEMKDALPSDNYTSESGIAFTLWRMSGVQMNYRKLITLGIPGLRSEIENYKIKNEKNSASAKLYSAMILALNTFSELCEFYANRAKELAECTTDKHYAVEYNETERVLRKLPNNKPETFREGLQLLFLYNAIDGARNYGRFDDALGDLYVNDLNNGILNEEKAIWLLSSIWKLIIDRNYRYDSRMIIGGKGRHNEENADKLALIILETTRRVKDIVPQLALRFHSNQNPELYKKSLNVIGQGNPFPMLYNDEVNIHAAELAFEISHQEATHIIQYGCGEYVINHRSVGTPSGVINLLQALLVTLHKGIDPVTDKPMGMPLSRYEKYADFETYESLWDAYKEQVQYHVDQLAKHEELEYVYAGKDAPFLYSSMLMDDCIQRGKSIYGGGIRYLGGTLEIYGNSNVADSLTAIKQLVYDKKRFSIKEIVEMIDADFVGFETERKLLLNCPKYGNDNEIADNMLVKVHDHICNYVRNQKDKTGLHSYLAVIINNDANTVMGENTPCSPDGRKAFTYLNPGNAPVNGADKKGVTAFFNSILKPNTAIHAGAVQNMKFSKEMFTKYRNKMEMLLSAYWKKGGAQVMFTVVGRNDLEDAMKYPENYPNLLVRVGGFSERFINLPKHTQLEVLNRTLHSVQ